MLIDLLVMIIKGVKLMFLLPTFLIIKVQKHVNFWQKYLEVKLAFIILRKLPYLGSLYHSLCKKLTKHFIAANIIHPPAYK